MEWWKPFAIMPLASPTITAKCQIAIAVVYAIMLQNTVWKMSALSSFLPRSPFNFDQEGKMEMKMINPPYNTPSFQFTPTILQIFLCYKLLAKDHKNPFFQEDYAAMVRDESTMDTRNFFLMIDESSSLIGLPYPGRVGSFGPCKHCMNFLNPPISAHNRNSIHDKIDKKGDEVLDW